MRRGTKVMRLTKGRKVEVFCTTKTAPNGCWKPVQIVCGNGGTYSVKYDPAPSSPENDTIIANEVPKKMIRPLPPVEDAPVNWVAGDLAEVFLSGIWRVAKVMAYDKNRLSFCFVLLSGNSRGSIVSKCNMRQRQMWAKNKWTLIKKDEILVFNGVTKELQVVPNKVKHRQSESMASSTSSCSTSGGSSPYQYPDFSLCEDDAESIFVPEKKPSLNFKEKLTHKMSTVSLMYRIF